MHLYNIYHFTTTFYNTDYLNVNHAYYQQDFSAEIFSDGYASLFAWCYWLGIDPFDPAPSVLNCLHILEMAINATLPEFYIYDKNIGKYIQTVKSKELYCHPKVKIFGKTIEKKLSPKRKTKDKDKDKDKQKEGHMIHIKYNDPTIDISRINGPYGFFDLSFQDFLKYCENSITYINIWRPIDKTEEVSERNISPRVEFASIFENIMDQRMSQKTNEEIQQRIEPTKSEQQVEQLPQQSQQSQQSQPQQPRPQPSAMNFNHIPLNAPMSSIDTSDFDFDLNLLDEPIHISELTTPHRNRNNIDTLDNFDTFNTFDNFDQFDQFDNNLSPSIDSSFYSDNLNATYISDVTTMTNTTNTTNTTNISNMSNMSVTSLQSIVSNDSNDNTVDIIDRTDHELGTVESDLHKSDLHKLNDMNLDMGIDLGMNLDLDLDMDLELDLDLDLGLDMDHRNNLNTIHSTQNLPREQQQWQHPQQLQQSQQSQQLQQTAKNHHLESGWQSAPSSKMVNSFTFQEPKKISSPIYELQGKHNQQPIIKHELSTQSTHERGVGNKSTIESSELNEPGMNMQNIDNTHSNNDYNLDLDLDMDIDMDLDMDLGMDLDLDLDSGLDAKTSPATDKVVDTDLKKNSEKSKLWVQVKV